MRCLQNKVFVALDVCVQEDPCPAWLSGQIPDRKWRQIGEESTYYGAAYEVTKSAGQHIDYPFSRWMHGMHPTLPPTPLIYTDGWARPIGARLLTHRTDQADYLNERADVAAIAVGAPILYAPDLPSKRISGSVLFMPRHSTAHYEYPESTDVMSSVEVLRRTFDRVVVSVYGTCAARGRLPELLEGEGIEWMVGAHNRDWHSLRRMKQMFNIFDFVATDTFGSHIAYAANFGAKVICVGNWKPLAEEEVLKDSIALRKRCPELIEWYTGMYAWESVKRTVPGIDDPDGSDSMRKAQMKWAGKILGVNNRKPAAEVVELLGSKWWVRLDNATRGRIRRGLHRWCC